MIDDEGSLTSVVEILLHKYGVRTGEGTSSLEVHLGAVKEDGTAVVGFTETGGPMGTHVPEEVKAIYDLIEEAKKDTP